MNWLKMRLNCDNLYLIILKALYKEWKSKIRKKEIWTFTAVLVIIFILLINLSISSLVFDNSDGTTIGVIMNIEGMVTALFFAISEIIIYWKLSYAMKKSLYFYYTIVIIFINKKYLNILNSLFSFLINLFNYSNINIT